MMVNFVSATYPTKDSIIEKIKLIKGENKIKIDTFVVDCDSIVNDTIISNKVIYKKILEKRVDTLYKDVLKVVTDTALEKKLRFDILNQTAKIDSLQSSLKISYYIIAFLIIFIVLLFVLK